jgi:hypothetical protein
MSSCVKVINKIVEQEECMTERTRLSVNIMKEPNTKTNKIMNILTVVRVALTS